MTSDPRSKQRKLRAMALLLASSLLLASCASLTNLLGQTERRVDVNAVACGAFKPITWSRNDTDQTLLQVRQHNAAWVALCGDN